MSAKNLQQTKMVKASASPAFEQKVERLLARAMWAELMKGGGDWGSVERWAKRMAKRIGRLR